MFPEKIAHCVGDNPRLASPSFQISFIIVGIILFAIGCRPLIHSDDVVRWGALQNLLEHGQIGTSAYSFIYTLFAIPLYAIGKITGNASNVVSYFNLIAFLVFGALILKLLARRISWSLARITALLILSASMFPLNLSYFGAETFSALAVTMGILLAAARPLLASVILGLGVANTPAMLPGLVLASVWMAWRWKRISLIFVPLCAGILFLGENVLKFGNPIHNPYLHGNAGFRTVLPYSGLPGFSYPIVFGVLNILFSIGKGLLFFIPGILAAFDKRLLEGPLAPICVEVEGMLAFVIGMILTYGKWWAWYGGFSWGPRFFLFACIPYSPARCNGHKYKEDCRGCVVFSDYCFPDLGDSPKRLIRLAGHGGVRRE